MLRFRKSAATASEQVGFRGLVNASQSGAGLVQVVVDNFDANISSQNGLRSTHALAVLLTQTATCDAEHIVDSCRHDTTHPKGRHGRTSRP